MDTISGMSAMHNLAEFHFQFYFSECQSHKANDGKRKDPLVISFEDHNHIRSASFGLLST